MASKGTTSTATVSTTGGRTSGPSPTTRTSRTDPSLREDRLGRHTGQEAAIGLLGERLAERALAFDDRRLDEIGAVGPALVRQRTQAHSLIFERLEPLDFGRQGAQLPDFVHQRADGVRQWR